MELAIWNSTYAPGLQKRVSILLGLRFFHSRSLTRVFQDKNLELLADDSFSPPEQPGIDDAVVSTDPAYWASLRVGLLADIRPNELADLSHIEAHLRQSFQPAPQTESEPGEGDEDRLFAEIPFLRDNVLSDSILRNGVYLDRYRVGSREEAERFPLIFRRDERELWWQLARYPTREAAIEAANSLRRLLIRLSVESEGLHVVEHILLRPLYCAGQPAAEESESLRDFYSFRISVFFPDWTARFHDPAFRRLAEETVQTTCPAHVYPEFHWLDFPAMRRFEELYQGWVEAKSGSAGAEAIDAASSQLTGYILDAGTARPVAPGEQP